MLENRDVPGAHHRGDTDGSGHLQLDKSIFHLLLQGHPSELQMVDCYC